MISQQFFCSILFISELVETKASKKCHKVKKETETYLWRFTLQYAQDRFGCGSDNAPSNPKHGDYSIKMMMRQEGRHWGLAVPGGLWRLACRKIWSSLVTILLAGSGDTAPDGVMAPDGVISLTMCSKRAGMAQRNTDWHVVSITRC